MSSYLISVFTQGRIAHSNSEVPDIMPAEKTDSSAGQGTHDCEGRSAECQKSSDSTVFFYGTLCHPGILKRVLGHDCQGLTFSDALLPVRPAVSRRLSRCAEML